MAASITNATSHASRDESTKRLAPLVLLAIAPALLLIGWINHYAVNVPVGDEWALVPMFEKWSNGQLTFADLYQQHNEHRILLPKVIYLAFGELTHWNLRAEMFFSVALCAATSAGILVLLRRTLDRPWPGTLLLWAAINLLLFSPAQAQNWLWGFQLQMFIPNLCLIAALVLLGSESASWLRLVGALLVVVAATFSFGGGLLLWPVVALFLLMRGETKARTGAWLLAGAVVAAVYFVGYQRVPRPQAVTLLDYPRYFLTFIGGGLVRGSERELLLGPLVAGAVGIATYAAMLLHFVKTGGEAMRNAAPWLAIGPYVIGSAALAAYSRVNWGPAQAMDSRYVTSSAFLYIAVIALAAVAVRHAPGTQRVRASSTAATASIVALTLAAFPAGLRDMATLNREQLAGVAALQFSKVIDTTESMRRDLRMVPGFVPEPLKYVAVLERLELLGYRRRDSALLDDANHREPHSPTTFGATNGFRASGPLEFEVSGWAVLPKQRRPAPLVVLAYLEGGRWTAFTTCDVWEYRDEVVARLRSWRYRESGWRKTVPRGSLPPQAERVAAWAVDPLTNKAHKLAGDHALPSI